MVSEGRQATIGHGAVVIAAITSCTNTSNPSVLMAAGLLARKAVERIEGPAVRQDEPGSRLTSGQRLPRSSRPHFRPGATRLSHRRLRLHDLYRQQRTAARPGGQAVTGSDLVAAAVLSGNRNFEGRVNPLVKANYLASPPLVVAYALAGTLDIDLLTEPLGQDRNGRRFT